MLDNSQMVAFVNGRNIPYSEALSTIKAVESRQQAVIYDAERTFNGQIFELRPHLERLYKGLELAEIDPGMTISEMESATLDVLRANRPSLEPHDDFVVRQLVSPSPPGGSASQGGADVIINSQPIDFPSFAQSYVTGVRVVTPITYSPANQSLTATPEEASQQTFSLMTDDLGYVTECKRANFMFVRAGRIKLPNREKVLPGVSMATTVRLAESLNIPIDEGDFVTWEVYQSDEALTTGTRYCLLPVATINGLSLPRELPGPLTRKLIGAWADHGGKDFVQQALSYLPSEEMGPPSQA